MAVFKGFFSTNAADERTDNTGTHTFAETGVGTSDNSQAFTIKNTGAADLSGLVVTKTGDFTVSQPVITTLAPNATTVFIVYFAPTETGMRTGIISIASNDADENPFEINVSGTGIILPPTLGAITSTAVSATSSTLSGNVTSDNGDAITERGFVFSPASVNGNPLIDGTGVTKLTTNGTTGTFTIDATDLTPGTLYFFKAFATNSGGTSYSALTGFTAGGVTFSDPVLTKVTYNTYTFAVEITGDGGNTITERGILWNDAFYPNPKVDDPGVNKVTSSDTTNAFTLTATNITVNSPHTMLAYVITNNGVFYSSHSSFMTFPPAAPTVTSPTAANITATAATLGGNITNDGGSPITERGIIFSVGTSFESPNKVIASSNSTGVFTVEATAGLVPEATFQYKAYAVNAVGTSYSSVSTFTTLPAGSPQHLIEQATGLAIGGFPVGWGTSWSGQMDFPSYLANVKQVATGIGHTLVLQTNGTVAAYGSNDSGERSVPAGLTGVASIAAGTQISAAVKTDGTVVAWGYDFYGAVTELSALTNVKAVDMHDFGSWVALKNDGTVVSGGHVGTVPADLPVIKAIACGQHHALALTEDGHVRAWASNNDNGEANVPDGLSDVIAISAGFEHSMALKQDGTVVVWGGARSAERAVPSGIANVVKIECGEENCFVVHADGTVTTWGPDNNYGTGSPPALHDVVSLSASSRHAVAVIGGLKFGTQRVGGDSFLLSFIVRNIGDAPLTISDAAIMGAHAGDFNIHSVPAGPITPGESSTMAVAFAPTAAGHRMAKLRFNTNDTTQAVVNIPLHGDAIDPKPPTGEDRVLTIYEDQSTGLNSGTFAFNDDMQSPQDNAVGIKIVTLPEHGTLWTYSGQITETGVIVPEGMDSVISPRRTRAARPMTASLSSSWTLARRT